MAHEGLRTTTAQQAMAVTEIVNRALADKIVGQDPPKRLAIRDLDVPSTDGGKRARQSIVLVPVEGGLEGGAMCGWIDTARREAELRTHDVVAKLHYERYRRALDVTATEYDALAAELRGLLALDSFEVRTAEPIEAPAAPEPRRFPVGLVVGVGFAALLLAAAAFAALG